MFQYFNIFQLYFNHISIYSLFDLSRNGGQWLAGKAMDSFCPIGPAIATREEVGDPHNLNLSCTVNGVVKQDSNTRQLVFGVAEVVSWISQFTTLLPGDIILTGTPPGVGVFMKPPEFLKKVLITTQHTNKEKCS